MAYETNTKKIEELERRIFEITKEYSDDVVYEALMVVLHRHIGLVKFSLLINGTYT